MNLFPVDGRYIGASSAVTGPAIGADTQMVLERTSLRAHVPVRPTGRLAIPCEAELHAMGVLPGGYEYSKWIEKTSVMRLVGPDSCKDS